MWVENGIVRDEWQDITRKAESALYSRSVRCKDHAST